MKELDEEFIFKFKGKGIPSILFDEYIDITNVMIETHI